MGIIAIFILFFVFIIGLKEGVVKNAYILIAHLIAIPLTGISITFWPLSSRFYLEITGKTSSDSLLQNT